MTKIFSIILLICSVLAAYYATRTLYNQNYKSRTYRLLSYTSLASCMWSAGYGMMLMTRNLASFTTARWFGILGIILFMVFAQLLMGAISDENNKLPWWVAIEICLGVVVFFLVVRPSAYRVIYKTDGLITEFTSPIVGITYTLYIVLIAAVFIGQSLSMAKSKESKLVKRLGKNTLKVEGLILVGIIIDTILHRLAKSKRG